MNSNIETNVKDREWNDGLCIIPSTGRRSTYNGVNRKNRRIFFIKHQNKIKQSPVFGIVNVIQPIKAKYEYDKKGNIKTETKTISQPQFYWKYEEVDVNFYKYENGKKTDIVWTTMKMLKKIELIKDIVEVTTIIPIIKKEKRTLFLHNPYLNSSKKRRKHLKRISKISRRRRLRNKK